MAKKPTYTTFKTSDPFQTRAEAKEWADEQKMIMTQSGQAVKIEIDMIEYSGQWKARILVKNP